MIDINNFQLVNHLQVYDEVLSSLYRDSISGKYYISVRIYEEDPEDSFILTEVSLQDVLEYMEGRKGLKKIFGNHSSYYLVLGKRKEEITVKDVKSEYVNELLGQDAIDDLFNPVFAFKSAVFKQYIQKLIK